jgi:hypothetical protein
VTTRITIGFLGLCLLSATRGAVTGFLPRLLPTLDQQILHLAVLAVVFGIIGARRLREAAGWRLAGYGVLFLPLPIVAASLAEGRVGTFTQVIVLTLLPAVVVLAEAQAGAAFGPEAEGTRLLIPAVAGAMGALFLLPVTLPPSTVSRLSLGGVVVTGIVAAVAATRLHRELKGRPVVASAGFLCGVCVLGLVAGWACVDRAVPALSMDVVLPELGMCAVFDAPIVLLTVWLLRAMTPVRFAARYLVIPLVAIVESLVVLRPHLTVFPWAGLGLLVFGAGALLRSGADSGYEYSNRPEAG